MSLVADTGGGDEGPSPELRSQYWLRTKCLTIGLLVAWFGVTFMSAYYAEALNQFEFLGFPLGFYLCAQGNLLVYLLIVAVYARQMNRLDLRFANRGPDRRSH